MSHRLEQIFQDCFYQHYLTRLVGGVMEPLCGEARPPATCFQAGSLA